jgi:16S rRNA (cytidine1402-2'-O)-methyltransferase
VGTLYLVATPIGNLDDISFRALDVLRRVRLIAAEDTRQTRKLLSRYGIQKELTSYFEHNKLARLEPILDVLQQGDVAVVSDAGTPGLNDPGFELVRAAIQAGHQVSPIPGACAPVAALVASGVPSDAFIYLGYLPRKRGERLRFLQKIADLPYTLILLEAPHRLVESLQDLEQALGDRQMAVARELTKLHEEIWRGTIGVAVAHFTQHEPRGEFTLVVAGWSGETERWSEKQLLEAARRYLEAGEPASRAAARLAEEAGWPRREVYQRLSQLVDDEVK